MGATRKRAILMDRDIAAVGRMADAMDIYTVQSEQRGTMYLWDGENMALYYYSALLKIPLDEAKKLAHEMLDVIADIEELQRMEIQFKGIKSINKEIVGCRITEE